MKEISPLQPTSEESTNNNHENRDLFIGTLFEGKYRINKKIGKGGMGVVYHADHLFTGRPVAIKFLHADLVKDNIAVKRFQREALAAGRLKHPNITEIVDFGVSTENNVFYLIMEYMEGCSLRDKLDTEDGLSLSETARIISQVCSAVDAAHKRNIVHRDLKPDNIFLQMESDGMETVKVLDFGIAKITLNNNATTKLTETGIMVGTPYYMSPEQCQSNSLDSRSDIYSLGVIIFEMLTGKLPYTGDSLLSIALKHVSEPVPSPKKYLSDLSMNIEKVIMRAMAKNPDDRYQSAMNLAEEFAEAAKSKMNEKEKKQNQTTLFFSNSSTYSALPSTKAIEKPTTYSIWKNKLMQVSHWILYNRRKARRKYLDPNLLPKVGLHWKDENGKTLESHALVNNFSRQGMLLELNNSSLPSQGEILTVNGGFWSHKTIVRRIAVKDELHSYIGVQSISDLADNLFS